MKFSPMKENSPICFAVVLCLLASLLSMFPQQVDSYSIGEQQNEKRINNGKGADKGSQKSSNKDGNSNTDVIGAVAESIEKICNQSAAQDQLERLETLNATVQAVLLYLDANAIPMTKSAAAANGQQPTVPPVQELLMFLTAQSQVVFHELLCIPEPSPPYVPIDMVALFRGQSVNAVRAAVQALGEIVESLISNLQRIYAQRRK